MKILLTILLSAIVLWAAEEETATIGKCLQELQSQDLNLRRRSALLIGKYDTAEANAALLQCLNDPDSQIRQSALVSINERANLPHEAKQAIFKLLADENVHIRRIASSMLPEALGVSLRGSISFNARIMANGGRSEEENINAAKCINAALGDEDASVRKNVLRAARFFPKPLDKTRLLPFLKDDNEELRCLALMCLANCEANRQETAADIATLTADPSEKVRTVLADTAYSLDKDGQDILRKLCQDQAHTVKVTALERYCLMPDEGKFSLLKEAIQDNSIPAASRTRLCRLLPKYGPDAQPLITSLLNGDNDMLKAEALRLLCHGNIPAPQLDTFFELANADSGEVRKMALLYLRRNLKEPTLEQVKKLYASRHNDSRQAALDLIRFQRDKAVFAEILLDACIDDDANVRLNAIRTISMHRMQGWEEILTSALQDDEPKVACAAASALATSMPNENTQQALREFLQQNRTDEALKKRIDRYLQRKVFK